MSLTSRDFRRPVHKEFYDALRGTDRAGVGFYTLFEDFLTLASCAIEQAVNKIRTGRLSDATEAEYMKTVGKYDRERAKGFGVAMSLVTQGLETEIHDFLGDVFSCTEISSHWHGQFFTPWPICQMMAKMSLHDQKPRKAKSDRFTVSEPAVGGGAMLLAMAVELSAAKFKPWHWWFEATDVDRRCAQMAYIQLSLAGAPGVVRHGNSLSLEQWGAWLTPAGALFPHFWPVQEPSNEPRRLPGSTQFIFDLAA